MEVFPFGCPVRASRPTSRGRRDLFLLGAYPSALHVQWRPPPASGARRVRALAVDNEPEPFWDGSDQETLVETWMTGRDWREQWGAIDPARRLNGPSGEWVQHQILDRFSVDRSAAWITDCLDTYRLSSRMRTAVEAVYQPFARAHDLPLARLAKHPSKDQIVVEAKSQHLGRLRHEIAAATPKVAVTLGNAALRVFKSLLDSPVGPRQLAADKSYGSSFEVNIDGTLMRWFPLAHPAAPPAYHKIHQGWAPPHGII